MVLLKDIPLNGATLEDCINAYNAFVLQDFVNNVLNSSENPNVQKSIIVDTIMWRQAQFKLKGNEELPFTHAEAYLALGIPKAFLHT
jgi:hypothetical protein